MSLYDPREYPTPRETVEVPSLDFTVAEFLDFARSKPADEEYDFHNASICAVAQFGIATGRKHLIGIGNVETAFPHFWRPFASAPFTFGGLVKRLEGLNP